MAGTFDDYPFRLVDTRDDRIPLFPISKDSDLLRVIPPENKDLFCYYINVSENFLPKDIYSREDSHEYVGLQELETRRTHDALPLHFWNVIGEAAEKKREARELAERAIDALGEMPTGQAVRVEGLEAPPYHFVNYRTINRSMTMQGKEVPLGNQYGEADQDVREPLTVSGTPEGIIAFAEQLKKAMQDETPGPETDV